MYNFSIGVMLESFHKSAAESMAIAQKLGAQGLQIYATPKALEQKGITTPKAQKEFFRMIKDHGLVVSALCGDLGHGFGKAELLKEHGGLLLIKLRELLLDAGADDQHLSALCIRDLAEAFNKGE